jgi:PAS domain S-box-containing protein
MVLNAQEIAEGKREQRITPGPEDEIGVLAHALNSMLSSLKKRELQIKEYTRTLEKRVQERTQDLVSSEEKYRTLVANLPLVVYRLLTDGTTEFINSYFTEKLGFSPNEVVGNKRFWQERIWGCDDPDIAQNVLADLVKKRKGFRVQRVVKDKAGRRLTFIDHAIPVFENGGDDLKWIEGIMVDITELKRLQEKALRTEEIRVLGEISARFAHEMRNPLATAGGFARRLRDSLKEDPYHQKLLNIIVEEVSRLEKILQIILNSIEPFSLSISMVDIKGLLQEVLSGLEPQMLARDIALKKSVSPLVDAFYGDGTLLKKAFDSLLKHAVVSMPSAGELTVSSRTEGDHLVFTIRHKANGMTQDDLDQFFYPHVTGTPESTILELPLSKIIIHRHGGKVDVFLQGEDIVLRVELPFIPVGMDKTSLDAATEEVPS